MLKFALLIALATGTTAKSSPELAKLREGPPNGPTTVGHRHNVQV